MVGEFWTHLSDHVACFLWKTYQRARDAFDSYDHLYTQHAILDGAYNQVQNQYEALQKKHDDLNDLVNILRRALHELEGNQEMLSDQLEGVHYGLVMPGGYSNHSHLNPQQRQHVNVSMWSVQTSLLQGQWEPTGLCQQFSNKTADPVLGKTQIWQI